ncbi:MAG: regulatory protein RecX [Gammaproteobacteria bacterium]|nr:MAG: regulatory protein RecX [Gammaproteobacteria bacterium]
MRSKSAQGLSEAEVRDIAVRYLARREYGIEELKRKLVQRGVESGMAAQVVTDCAEQGLVSDERFTEMYVRVRIRRLFGPVKIHGELRQRGIPDHLIVAGLQFDEETWLDAAARWADRRIQGELDFAQQATIHRKLMSRGFSHEQASIALKRLTHGE